MLSNWAIQRCREKPDESAEGTTTGPCGRAMPAPSGRGRDATQAGDEPLDRAVVRVATRLGSPFLALGRRFLEPSEPFGLRTQLVDGPRY